MKVIFQSIHFTADQKLKDYISTKLEKVQKYNEQIIDVRVNMKLENSGQVKDKIIELIVNAPGGPFVCSEASKTFESSCDLAIETLKRLLKRQKEKVISRKRSR